MKQSMMCFAVVIAMVVGVATVSQAQSGPTNPSMGETLIGFSQDVSGSLTNLAVRPSGCGTRVCFTNTVPVIRCTNVYETVVICRTNSEQTVICVTNTVPRYTCWTNYVNRVVCTNDVGSTPNLKLRQAVHGAVTANPSCDELVNKWPTNTTIEIMLETTLRQPDWRGVHSGWFTIRAGTNVVATGSVSGNNGIGSHGAQEPCAVCNHLEGSLRGVISLPGPLRGAKIQASYSGDLPQVNCPSPVPPAGDIQLSIDGLVIAPCSPTVLVR